PLSQYCTPWCYYLQSSHKSRLTSKYYRALLQVAFCNCAVNRTIAARGIFKHNSKKLRQPRVMKRQIPTPRRDTRCSQPGIRPASLEQVHELTACRTDVTSNNS